MRIKSGSSSKSLFDDEMGEDATDGRASYPIRPTGSRPIEISKSVQPKPSMLHLSHDFKPPHEICAAEFEKEYSIQQECCSSTRHKSVAEKLKSVVFEQTGFVPMSTARGFLTLE